MAGHDVGTVMTVAVAASGTKANRHVWLHSMAFGGQCTTPEFDFGMLMVLLGLCGWPSGNGHAACCCYPPERALWRGLPWSARG